MTRKGDEPMKCRHCGETQKFIEAGLKMLRYRCFVLPDPRYCFSTGRVRKTHEFVEQD